MRFVVPLLLRALHPLCGTYTSQQPINDLCGIYALNRKPGFEAAGANLAGLLVPEHAEVTLAQEQAAPFLKGAEPIVIGGCLIYASITADDTRRAE